MAYFSVVKGNCCHMNLVRKICVIICLPLLITLLCSSSCSSKYTGQLTPEDFPFEDLVEEADIIVICHVTKIEVEVEGVIELRDETPSGTESFVTFSVVETLKGELIPEFTVSHPGMIADPRIPIYHLGERRLIFVYDLPDGYVAFMGYGSYVIDEENLIWGEYPLKEVTEEIRHILRDSK